VSHQLRKAQIVHFGVDTMLGEERDIDSPGRGRQPSAYELWTWGRCRGRILSLRHRLGYGERLWVLGYDLLEDGCLVDPFRGIVVFDPEEAPVPTSIPYHYSAVPEMYCLLYTYAAAEEKPLSGELQPPDTLHTTRRFELKVKEAEALLQYAGKDLIASRSCSNPFIGGTLSHGDFSFQVWPLPRVPVTIVLWRDDEETGDGGTVLFDGSVSCYLPGLEVEMAGLTVWRLRNMLDQDVKWGYHQLADP
jgi:hypothetical protein